MKKGIPVFLATVMSIGAINSANTNIELQKKNQELIKMKKELSKEQYKKYAEFRRHLEELHSNALKIAESVEAKNETVQIKLAAKSSVTPSANSVAKKPDIKEVVSTKPKHRASDLASIRRQYVASRGAMPVRLSQEDFNVLVRAVQGEALAEPYQGKVAVAAVIINRAKLSGQPIRNIVYAPNQFSCVGSQIFKSNEISSEVIRACLTALDGVDPTYGATHFINLKIAKANWTKEFTFTTRIGNHWFYRNEKAYKK